MTQKVKIVEVEATKLDPNARYLIVFNGEIVPLENARNCMDELERIGVTNIAGFMTDGLPDNALKIYAIPKENN